MWLCAVETQPVDLVHGLGSEVPHDCRRREASRDACRKDRLSCSRSSVRRVRSGIPIK
ncbi:hypothetical protein MLPF_0217 [Mycobacterium lepromatosis]|nr:hypothetical protein MLPF_0217 [Mycobacterium lepromatosis]